MDFRDFGWLADIARQRAVLNGRIVIPDRELGSLVRRGLVERSGVTTLKLTRRGEIALSKLG